MKEEIKEYCWIISIIASLLVSVIIVFFIGSYFLRNESDSSFPEQFIDDRTNFIQSVTLLSEAGELTQPQSDNLSEEFTITEEQEQEIYSKIEEGLALSKKVDDAFLDYLSPELKSYYRNKLIIGYEIYYKGIKLNNGGNTVLGVQQQIYGNNLITEWHDWWAIHNENLADKAYP